jgi:hypothetical protein
MGAYLLSVPIEETTKTDSKTSKIGIFVSSSSLTCGGLPDRVVLYCHKHFIATIHMNGKR